MVTNRNLTASGGVIERKTEDELLHTISMEKEVERSSNETLARIKKLAHYSSLMKTWGNHGAILITSGSPAAAVEIPEYAVRKCA